MTPEYDVPELMGKFNQHRATHFHNSKIKSQLIHILKHSWYFMDVNFEEEFHLVHTSLYNPKGPSLQDLLIFYQIILMHGGYKFPSLS